MKAPIRVSVTGAAGNIGYALLFRLAAGDCFGLEQPIILQLLEIPPAMNALAGVVMELNDSAFPLLHGIETSDDPNVAFRDANFIFLVGSKPRKDGMDRSDLIKTNGPIFTGQGRAINDNAAADVRVIVVGNPCNTNALIAMHSAPGVPNSRFTAMTRLDQNRAVSQIASKLNVTPGEITKLAIWGNHSKTMFPDFYHAEVNGKPLLSLVDESWLQNEFLQTVSTRGGAIIKARGASSAASAASAAIDHMSTWYHGTVGDNYVSMAVPSNGSYGVPEGLIFSFPVLIENGKYKIVEGLEHSEYSKNKIEATAQDLVNERAAVADLLG